MLETQFPYLSSQMGKKISAPSALTVPKLQVWKHINGYSGIIFQKNSQKKRQVVTDLLRDVRC